MKKAKVFGIGSRIMGDDGIGVYVVEELVKQKFLNNTEYLQRDTDINIEYIIGETDLDYCLDCLNFDDDSLIIILDAAISGKEPGTVTKFTINDMALCTSMTFSAHNQELIGATSRQTNYPNLLVIGIEPEIVDFKWGLSDTLSKAFFQIIADVKKLLLNMEFE